MKETSIICGLCGELQGGVEAGDSVQWTLCVPCDVTLPQSKVWRWLRRDIVRNGHTPLRSFEFWSYMIMGAIGLYSFIYGIGFVLIRLGMI